MSALYLIFRYSSGFLLGCTLLLSSVRLVTADTPCAPTLSTTSYRSATTVNADLVITNTSESPVRSLYLYLSTPDVIVASIDGATGWETSISEGTHISLLGGTLPVAESLTLRLTLQTGATDATTSLTVQASPQDDGNGLVECGSIGLTVTQVAIPVISNARVLSISNTNATIEWTTDLEASTVVEYGTSTDYGMRKESLGTTTSHKVVLEDLQASTQYHARLLSLSSDGAVAQSADFSFVTSTSPVIVTAEKTITVETVRTVSLTPATPRPDQQAPTIRVRSRVPRLISVSPTIEGVVQEDRSGPPILSYTLEGSVWTVIPLEDDGRSFRLQLPSLPDGDYALRLKATDQAGNSSTSPVYSFTIDRLPPILSGITVRSARQLLIPEDDGSFSLTRDDPVTIALFAVGGPKEIELQCGDQRSVMRRQIALLQWSATFLPTLGSCALEARAVDSAGRVTVTALGTLHGRQQGQVTLNGQPAQAKLTVYELDQLSGDFKVWNAGPTKQENPFQTTQDGRFMLVLPKGTYFLEAVSSVGSRRTTIFSLQSPRAIAAQIQLRRNALSLVERILARFDTGNYDQSLSFAGQQTRASMIGMPLPYFSLAGVTKDMLFGRPTILSVFPSQHPLLDDTFTTLATVANQSTINTVLVLTHDTSAKSLLQKKAPEKLRILADPDGKLTSVLSITRLPMHLLIDRSGRVVDIRYDLLTTEELDQTLLKTLSSTQ